MDNTNKCGPDKTPVSIPQFIFEADCKKHDALYKKGGNKYDRFVADWLFYRYMLKDVLKQKWYKMPYYYFWALSYYKTVRLFGWEFFNYTK